MRVVCLFARALEHQVPKDEAAAVEILTKCSKMGDPLGCHLLSVCHEKGLGIGGGIIVARDEKAALELCKRARALGRVECEQCVKRVRTEGATKGA